MDHVFDKTTWFKMIIWCLINICVQVIMLAITLWCKHSCEMLNAKWLHVMLEFQILENVSAWLLCEAYSY